MNEPKEEDSALRHFNDLPEMIESVLLFVPDRQLLSLQRVSRLWKSIINESVSIRRKLWYEPQAEANDPDSTHQTEREAVIQWNPFITRLGLEARSDGKVKALFEATGGLPAIRMPPLYAFPGSWTNMLATQPACPVLRVKCQNSLDSRKHYTINSYRPEGLLVGELIATLAEAWDRRKRDVDDVGCYMRICRPAVAGELIRSARPELIREISSLKIQDPSAEVRVVVEQSDLTVDAAFSLKECSPIRSRRPDQGSYFRMVKTDYPMNIRCLSYFSLPRIDTGYMGNLVEAWGPYGPPDPCVRHNDQHVLLKVSLS